MKNHVQTRKDFILDVGGFLASRPRPERRVLVALIISIWLAAPSRAAGARDPKLMQPQGAPPDLQITQVKSLATASNSAMTEIEIRWTAQVPRLTNIEGFDVLLEVRYSDGSRNAAHGEQLKPSARSCLLQVATRPRPNSTAALKDFKVSVKARFKIASSFTVVQQVAAAQSANIRATAGSSSSSQPEVFITAAKLVAQGCQSGQQCVDVKWTANVPRHITINEFTVNVDALHKSGTRSTDAKTVNGADRQARLQAGPTGSEISSLKVSLLTSFSALDFKTVVKEGALGQVAAGSASSADDHLVKASASPPQ